MSTETERLQMLLKSARKHRDAVDTEPLALRAIEQVLEIDPAHPEALAILSDTFEARRDWKAFIAVCKQQLSLDLPVATQSKILFRLGAVYDSEENQTALAEQCYLESNSRAYNQNALRCLRRMYLEQKNTTGVRWTLERELENTTDEDERAAIQKSLRSLAP